MNIEDEIIKEIDKKINKLEEKMVKNPIEGDPLLNEKWRQLQETKIMIKRVFEVSI